MKYMLTISYDVHTGRVEVERHGKPIPEDLMIIMLFVATVGTYRRNKGEDWNHFLEGLRRLWNSYNIDFMETPSEN